MTDMPQPVVSVSKDLAKRKAGRPKANHLQGNELREHIISAAALVYAEHGYHGSSVDKIAKAAGVSRPLFYRHFKSKDHVLDILIARLNQELLDENVRAITPLNDLFDVLGAAIDVYFAWCLRHKAVVRSIYREINDLSSPAGQQYQRTVEAQLHNDMAKFATLDIPAFSRELITVLTKAVEYAGAQITQAEDDQQIEFYRAIVKRIVFSSVATDADKHRVPDIQTVTERQGINGND